jgi:hypothetical protein
VPGLVQLTCSLAKLGRPSASLATTSPLSTAVPFPGGANGAMLCR